MRCSQQIRCLHAHLTVCRLGGGKDLRRGALVEVSGVSRRIPVGLFSNFAMPLRMELVNAKEFRAQSRSVLRGFREGKCQMVTNWHNWPRAGFRLVAISVCLSWPCMAQQPTWVAEGPAPNTRGQVENIDDREVTGAIESVATHPSDPRILFIGAVNGGIWRTLNATEQKPRWEHLTDGLKSPSIGALEFDPTDSTHQTLVAGTGRFSSLGEDGGARIGLLRTDDRGASWSVLDGGGALAGLNISGVAPRGKILVVSVNAADDQSKVGIWRSINGGQNWQQLSGVRSSGVPVGASTCLAADPTDSSRLVTLAGRGGLFLSLDTGASWSKVSNAVMDALIRQADNVKISVSTKGNVFAAIDVTGRLAGVFRSDSTVSNWQQLDLPTTIDGGIHPGGQGGIHLSIAADRSNPNIFYVGGDRQPGRLVNGVETPQFPNSIGAMTYS